MAVSRRPRHLALALALLVFAGCSTRTTVPRVESVSGPTTPQNAVKLFEWAFVNRDLPTIASLLTADFEFLTAGTDSAGNPARVPVGRDSVLSSLRAMFESVPPAEVTLNFDQNLRALPDPRPGREDSVHRTIRTSVDLHLVDPVTTSTYEVTGYLLFYLVRGDFASLPADQVALGARPDRNRWWIERLDDEMIATEATHASANPTSTINFGWILRLFRWRYLE